MARYRRGRVFLRPLEWQRLLHAAEVGPQALPDFLPRQAYRSLLDAADNKQPAVLVSSRTRRSREAGAPRTLLTLVFALGALCFGACSARTAYQIDPRERLVGVTRAPLHPVAFVYTARASQLADVTDLRIEQIGQCQQVEQRIYEKPDVPARRMRQRYETHVDPTLTYCEQQPARYADVAVHVGSGTVSLGQTDALGHLALSHPSILTPDAILLVNQTPAAIVR